MTYLQEQTHNSQNTPSSLWLRFRDQKDIFVWLTNLISYTIEAYAWSNTRSQPSSCMAMTSCQIFNFQKTRNAWTSSHTEHMIQTISTLCFSCHISGRRSYTKGRWWISIRRMKKEIFMMFVREGWLSFENNILKTCLWSHRQSLQGHA